MTEKKLLHTMDMILVKKKRIALAKRKSLTTNKEHLAKKSGIWNMLSSVTVSRGSDESECSIIPTRSEDSFLNSRNGRKGSS